MIYIGLDLATYNTGCCVIDSKENLIHYELIQVSKKEKDFRKRITCVGEKIEALILAYSPDFVAMEEPPIIKNSSASMLLILHGYILSILNRNKVRFVLFQPAHWRSALGIIGHNGRDLLKKDEVKRATVNYVNNKFCTCFKYIKDSDDSDDDITDSIGVALCAIKEEELSCHTTEFIPKRNGKKS